MPLFLTHRSGFGLCLYLLRTGYRGLSDQPVRIRKIGLLPILFLLLALAEIQNTLNLSWYGWED
ncbi:hypothetical protein P4S72_17010 [Vibrio sp. PP-XX7]